MMSSKPFPAKQFRIFTWYRCVAFALVLPRFLAVWMAATSTTAMFYYMFPAIRWSAFISPRHDGAWLWRDKTPLQSYKYARYQRIWLIPFFAFAAAGIIVFRHYLTSGSVAIHNWLLMLATLALSSYILIRAPGTIRKLRQ